MTATEFLSIPAKHGIEEVEDFSLIHPHVMAKLAAAREAEAMGVLVDTFWLDDVTIMACKNIEYGRAERTLAARGGKQ